MANSERFAVLILQGTADYDSIGAFDREVARIIRAMTDFDVLMLDLNDHDNLNPRLKKMLDDYPNRIVAVFSFSGFGIELVDANKTNIWQKLGLPMLTFLLDHPGYILARHKTATPAVMRIYPNRDFLGFHRDYIRAPYRTSFCAWGAMSFGRQPYPREPKPGETPLIILPKSGANPAELEAKWKLLPDIMQRVIRDAVDYYWGETPRSGPVNTSVLAAADAAGLELRNDLPLFSFFAAELDFYIRRRKTDLMLRALLPLPVKIYGKGLEYIDCANARAQVLPPIQFDELINLIFKGFAVISMNPNIDHECHDRPYIALGSGALPISDINPWWAENFPDLLPYSYDFRDRSIVGAVELALADPVKAASVAWQASQRQCRTRTFEHTVTDMLALAAMHSYFTFRFKTPNGAYIKYAE